MSTDNSEQGAWMCSKCSILETKSFFPSDNDKYPYSPFQQNCCPRVPCHSTWAHSWRAKGSGAQGAGRAAAALALPGLPLACAARNVARCSRPKDGFVATRNRSTHPGTLLVFPEKTLLREKIHHFLSWKMEQLTAVCCMFTILQLGTKNSEVRKIPL